MSDTPLQQLKKVIADMDPPLTKVAILMHHNPDPDCIAAAIGLEKILKTWNATIQCSSIYSGEISHAQNKTMVNVLNITLLHISEIENLKEHADVFITVDVMPERCLDKGIPEDIECLMVIDHHRSETKKAQITDIRPLGATSTIIWEYIRQEEIVFKKNNENDTIVATALLVGIKTDTADLVSENVTNLDFEAYQGLMQFVDRAKLISIVNYPIPTYQIDLRSQLDKPDNCQMDNGVYVGGIGSIAASKRDVLATLAEERSRLEDVNTAFIFAIVGDYIEISARSINLSIDIGTMCQKIFGKQFGGGKQGAGATKIPLGHLIIGVDASNELKEKQWEFIKSFVIYRIFHFLNNV